MDRSMYGKWTGVCMVSVVSCVLYKECLQSQFDSFKKSRGCGTVHHELRTDHVFETNDPKICGTISQYKKHLQVMATMSSVYICFKYY